MKNSELIFKFILLRVKTGFFLEWNSILNICGTTWLSVTSQGESSVCGNW